VRHEHRRLAELELEHSRGAVGERHQVDAGVEQRHQRCGQRLGCDPQRLGSHRPLRRRRLAWPDLLAGEEAANDLRPPGEDGVLADGVAEAAIEVDQGRLAFFVDGMLIGLHHRHPPGCLQTRDVRERRLAVSSSVASSVVGASRHRRLDDDVELAVCRQRRRLARRDERRRHDRHSRALEIAQVALVGVPPQHRHRVMQLARHGDALGPGQELLAARVVVPSRAQDDEVEPGPLDRRVVPHDLDRLEPARRQRREQQRHVLVEPARTGGRHQRDAAGLALRPHGPQDARVSHYLRRAAARSTR
jgi:hypothetical protein